MDIVLAMILGIVIKMVSAVIEIAINIEISNKMGISDYGTYTFYVSVIEGLYLVFFSGVSKINTYYLSTKSLNIDNFKHKYILKYATPVIAVVIICSIFLQNIYGVLAGVILAFHLIAFDKESVLIARGYQLIALMGEYLISRFILLMGTIFVIKLNTGNIISLLLIYGFQFIVMLAWFVPSLKKLRVGNEEAYVPVKKAFKFQISDAASSISLYIPAILQFIFGGAITAGFAGIVSIVKKFVYFTLGPIIKVVMPEFAHHYKNGNKAELENMYIMIVHIQMIVLSTMGVLFIGFPRLVLQMFSPELLRFADTFAVTSACFLLIACIGPVNIVLQMTENESIANRNQWLSIGVMVLVCFMFREKTLFAVYGLCAQVVSEGIMNYVSICRWFGKNMISVSSFILSWTPTAIICIIDIAMGIQYSYIAMIVGALVIMTWNMVVSANDPLIRNAVIRIVNRK